MIINRLSNSRKGFTLVEFIVVIIIMGIVTVAISPFLISVIDIMIYDQMRAEIVADAQYVLDRIRRSVKNSSNSMLSSQTGPGGSNLRSLNIYDKGIFMYNGSLVLSFGGMGMIYQPLSSYVKSITFRYFDRDGNEITEGWDAPLDEGGSLTMWQCSSVRSIRINMILQNPNISTMPPIHIESDISPRNWNVGTQEKET